MSIQVGDVVKYGANGDIGRVCKISFTNFCCVQFKGHCLRIHKSLLEKTQGDAPACDIDCHAGC